MLTGDGDTLTGMSTYIDGKLKRYNLLFAVNGGAFAIAQVIVGRGQGELAPGGLELHHLAIGAIVFTGVMAVDIYLFAEMMRRRFLGPLVFGPAGKIVLALLTLLPVLGWTAVAPGRSTIAVVAMVVLSAAVAIRWNVRQGGPHLTPPRPELGGPDGGRASG
jgi:hypothetical protein